MSQVYLTPKIAIIRDSSAADWLGYTGSGAIIIEETVAATLQSVVIVESSDGNEKLFHEMKIDNYQTYDETGTPAPGDLTYLLNFIAIVKEDGATTWTAYKGSSTTIDFSSDKLTFLNTIRQAYGDGKFRIFQEIVQSHTHGFVLVP